MYNIQIIYVLVGGINLITQDLTSSRGIAARRVSKSLLMPVLLSLYMYRSRVISPWIIAALLFCWIGDLLLMGKAKRQNHQVIITETNFSFLAGLTAFLLGHMAYVVFLFSHIEIAYLVPLPVILSILFWYSLLLFKGVKPQGTIMIGMILYMATIGAMLTSVLLLLYQQPSLSTTYLVLGALSFGSSDSVLAFRRIKKIKKLPSSFVMFSYITGQFLLISGMMGL